MRMIVCFLCIAFSGAAFAGPLGKVWIRGTTDRNPLSYKPGVEMVFTLAPMDVEGEIPAGGYGRDWTVKGEK